MEIKVGTCYPDVVFVEYNPENFQTWNNTRYELDKSDLKILYNLYLHSGLSAQGIINQLGISWKELLISIEKLYDSKLIIRDNFTWKISDINNIAVKK